MAHSDSTLELRSTDVDRLRYASDHRTLEKVRPAVLLALPARLEPDDILQHARTLCEVFDAKLFVLRVASTPSPSNGRRGSDASTPEMVTTETLRWHKRALGEEIARDQVCVCLSQFKVAVTEVAQAIQPCLVVIPYLEAGDGELITRIVRDTAIAVLAARSTHHGDGVVAATDLSDQRYPVLRQGLRIACGQVAPITFIHNVTPAAFASRTHRCIRRSLVSLEDIGRELGAKCARITANQTDTVDAILTVAETQRANLIVVGTHLNPRHERDRRRKSVARQVVEQATRSVLVVPVRGPGMHAGGALAR